MECEVYSRGHGLFFRHIIARLIGGLGMGGRAVGICAGMFFYGVYLLQSKDRAGYS